MILSARHVRIALAVVLLGCGTDSAVVQSRPDPFLYLVLNQPSFSPDPAYQQRALFITIGSPANSSYREAEQFRMYRVSDGAPFAWTHLGITGQVTGDPLNTALINGNYGLSSEPASGSHGSGDLAAGETYQLEIESLGAVITGSVTIPPAFVITVREENGARVAHWPRVVPGGLFSVELLGQTSPRFQAETLYVLPALFEATDLAVRALDANLSRYLDDEQSVVSGLEGAFGVFGAITNATVRVVP